MPLILVPGTQNNKKCSSQICQLEKNIFFNLQFFECSSYKTLGFLFLSVFHFPLFPSFSHQFSISASFPVGISLSHSSFHLLHILSYGQSWQNRYHSVTFHYRQTMNDPFLLWKSWVQNNSGSGKIRRRTTQKGGR